MERDVGYPTRKKSAPPFPRAEPNFNVATGTEGHLQQLHNTPNFFANCYQFEAAICC
jgi:hypothetical protein